MICLHLYVCLVSQVPLDNEGKKHQFVLSKSLLVETITRRWDVSNEPLSNDKRGIRRGHLGRKGTKRDEREGSSLQGDISRDLQGRSPSM